MSKQTHMVVLIEEELRDAARALNPGWVKGHKVSVDEVQRMIDACGKALWHLIERPDAPMVLCSARHLATGKTSEEGSTDD